MVHFFLLHEPIPFSLVSHSMKMEIMGAHLVDRENALDEG